VTEDELILSLCKEKDFWVIGSDDESVQEFKKGEVGSDDELIQKFKKTYKDQSELLAKAALGDAKALRQLRWILGLKVIT
jgi:hypothetical protein